MTSYKEFQVEDAPPWLQGPNGKALLETIGEAKDIVVTAAKDAVKCRFVDDAPQDALAYVGAGRNLVRYPADSDEGWRSRCRNAWNTWEFAGTGSTLQSELQLYLPNASWSIVANRDWPSPPDRDTANWSRFWVIVESPHPWTSVPQWGSDAWGQNTWGSNATSEQVRSVRGIVRKWKCARNICPQIIVVISGQLWGRFTWGSQSWGAKSVRWPG